MLMRTRTHIVIGVLAAAGVSTWLGGPWRLDAQAPPAKPVFENGQAQIVPAFEDSSQWIRHHLWVEAEFDSDGDKKRDRLHVDVTRQMQTDSRSL